MDPNLRNRRKSNETYEEYRAREKQVRANVKRHLKGRYICRHTNKRGLNTSYRRKQ